MFRCCGYRLFYVLLTLLLSGSAYATEKQLEIAEAIWTDGVDQDKQPQQVYEQRASEPPLVLWMRLRGSSTTLETLRDTGKMPIRHKWFHLGFSQIAAEGVQTPVDTITLNLGNAALLDKLGLEIEERGFFDWRTWSRKRNIRPGWWQVKVVYADNTPVLCEQDKPCEYYIEVD
ncbi:MAG: DUF2914 domain-containing protein [Pseudomonadota bacterium]